MNGWAFTLALVSAAVNAFGVAGGRRALREFANDLESRAAAWYLIVRSSSIALAAVIGAIGVLIAWSGPMKGWVFAVAGITLAVQLLDVPVWLLRKKPLWAAGAFGLAVVVLSLGIVVFVRT